MHTTPLVDCLRFSKHCAKRVCTERFVTATVVPAVPATLRGAATNYGKAMGSTMVDDGGYPAGSCFMCW